MPSRSTVAIDRAEDSSMPLLHMNAFSPIAPASRRPAGLVEIPRGQAAPQREIRRTVCSSASARISRGGPPHRAPGGSELSGMSKKPRPAAGRQRRRTGTEAFPSPRALVRR